MNIRVALLLLFATTAWAPPVALAQGGFGGRFGFGQQETKLVEQFDKDGDHRLDSSEREAARTFLESQRGRRRELLFHRKHLIRNP